MLSGRRKPHRRSARGSDARRQLGEVGEIPVDRRQVFDSRRVDERADNVLCLDEGRLPRHGHILLNRADAEHHVNLGFLPDAQDHVRALCRRKPGKLDGELVGAHR